MGLLLVGAKALAAFLDFSMGAFVTFVVARLYGYDIPIVYYITGGFIAALPDFDVLYYAIIKKEVVWHHQKLLHRPLVMMAAALFVGLLFLGNFWTTTILICLFWHYVHDTEGVFAGGGIAWFWPFSGKYFSPFTGFIDHKESLEAKWMEKFREVGWLTHYWLQPSVFSVPETIIAASALSIILTSIVGWIPAIASALTILAVEAFIWVVCAKMKE